MDLNKQMKADEQEIKNIVNALDSAHGQGLKARCDREIARDRLGEKLTLMRSFMDLRMSGKNGHERSILEYKLRLLYPYYAHVTSISQLSGNHAVACDLWEDSPSVATR
jgi:hypothetical protein